MMAMPSEPYSVDRNPIEFQNKNSVLMQPDASTVTPPYLNGKTESPELLRWRADLLLDEMMLGGADVGSGHYDTNGRYPNGAPQQLTNGQLGTSVSHELTNGTHQDFSYRYQDSNGNGVHAPNGLPEVVAARPNPEAIDSSASQPLLISAEQRYAKLAQPAATETVDRTVDTRANQKNSPSQPLFEPVSSQGLGPVRRSSANGVSNAGTMSVASRNSKYSTLLPRESTTDPELLEREIVELSNQLVKEMPPQHESRERAQKLLDKANTILQSDPMRSAEVDYYLQQVRSMIERLRQSLSYSALYQRRLRTYLLAWLLLALVAIVGCFAYGKDLVNFVLSVADWDKSTVGSQHMVAFILTLFAGGLGGTLCAMWSLRTQPYRESGFLDRKFSLRNMIFPIMGFIAGAFIYLLLGSIFWGFGLNPASNLLLTLVPMLLALLLAGGQEFMFGVRA